MQSFKEDALILLEALNPKVYAKLLQKRRNPTQRRTSNYKKTDLTEKNTRGRRCPKPIIKIPRKR
jgi:hypothetical protein